MRGGDLSYDVGNRQSGYGGEGLVFRSYDVGKGLAKVGVRVGVGIDPTMWVSVRQSGCEGEGMGWGSVLRCG